MTLIVIADRFTSFILGLDIVVRRTISSSDFLRCIDHASAGQCLSNELQRALEATLSIEADAPELRLGFGSLFVDNALAHLSDTATETPIACRAGVWLDGMECFSSVTIDHGKQPDGHQAQPAGTSSGQASGDP
ncbi:hypothetical protein G6F50_015232 [Rhizopus delemar]|uniref:Uncharacterized protein n=1 Tax=Rhizopus delemar TaxID=936053 RepID=A0A9P6XZ39_9FUNG|nr:hypothetical protein G6F50_015232 [Rhizopus delemar]